MNQWKWKTGAAAMLLAGLTLLTACGADAITAEESAPSQSAQVEETVVGSETVVSEEQESEIAQSETDSQNWYDLFSMDNVQEITIYCSADDYTEPFALTGENQVAEVAASVDFSQWEEVPLEEQSGDVPAYYIDFGNGTVIAMYAESGYGEIGTGVFFERDEDGRLTSWGLEGGTGKTYTFHDGLFDAITEVFMA